MSVRVDALALLVSPHKWVLRIDYREDAFLLCHCCLTHGPIWPLHHSQQISTSHGSRQSIRALSWRMTTQSCSTLRCSPWIRMPLFTMQVRVKHILDLSLACAFHLVCFRTLCLCFRCPLSSSEFPFISILAFFFFLLIPSSACQLLQTFFVFF